MPKLNVTLSTGDTLFADLDTSGALPHGYGQARFEGNTIVVAFRLRNILWAGTPEQPVMQLAISAYKSGKGRLGSRQEERARAYVGEVMPKVERWLEGLGWERVTLDSPFEGNRPSFRAPMNWAEAANDAQ